MTNCISVRTIVSKLYQCNNVKWLPGASKEFHSSVYDVSARSKQQVCVILNQCSPHSAPAGSESWAGPRSHGELVTEGETVKLRQQRDVTRDTSRRAASCCASSPWVDARTLDLRMVFGKMNGTNKCGHYIKKKIVNIYYVVTKIITFILEKTGQAYRSVSWEHPNLLPFISA